MGPKTLPKCFQNRSKIDKNRVLEGLGPQEPQEAQNGLQKAVRVSLLGSLLEAHLGPCWAQKPQKFDLEGIQKTHQLGHRFFIDFGASWTSFWEGFGTHVGLQEGPKIDVKLTSKFDRFFDRFWSRFSSILKPLETSKSSSRLSGVRILRL